MQPSLASVITILPSYGIKCPDGACIDMKFHMSLIVWINGII